MKHWSASFSLHAIVLVALLVVQWELRHAVQKKTSEWDVSMLESPVAAEQHATPQILRRPKAVEPLKSAPVPAQSVQAPVPEPPETVVAPPVTAIAPAPVPSIPTQVEPVIPEKPLADSAWLTQALWGLMNARKHYPLMARRMGVEGRVLVEASIDEYGQLIRATVKQSSGSKILDDDALKLLRAVTPLKLDKFNLAPNTTVEIPISYHLE